MATDNSLLITYLKNHAPADMIMLDIGSKKGKWLVPFVEQFTNANFYCFEALPEEYERLVSRYKHFPNVTSYNFVISDKNESQITFYRDKVRPSWSGMQKHQYLDDFDEITLISRTIDSFNLKPYCIKIDVEGAELLALEGSKNTLETTRVIFFECNEVHFKNYNYTSELLFDFLNERKFQITIDGDKVISKEEFCFLTEDQRRYENPKEYVSNFLAIKQD